MHILWVLSSIVEGDIDFTGLNLTFGIRENSTVFENDFVNLTMPHILALLCSELMTTASTTAPPLCYTYTLSGETECPQSCQNLNWYIQLVPQINIYMYIGFFLEKNFRGDETKFSRNEGGQAKIHKIYVAHTLSTCTLSA